MDVEEVITLSLEVHRVASNLIVQVELHLQSTLLASRGLVSFGWEREDGIGVESRLYFYHNLFFELEKRLLVGLQLVSVIGELLKRAVIKFID